MKLAKLSLSSSDDAGVSARQAAEGSEYSSGVYGDVIDESSIDNADDATTVAYNALRRYGAVPYSLKFSSFANDWEAGTKLKVNLPTFGISTDAYFLIESVDLRDVDGVNLQSTISATRRRANDFSTQRSENWKDYFAKLASAKDGVPPVSTSEAQYIEPREVLRPNTFVFEPQYSYTIS